MAYIQSGDEGQGNNQLAREIAKEVLGDKFKEGDYACKMNFSEMQKVMVDYFKTHERKTTGVIKVLVSEASDFYDDSGERYDAPIWHAAVINSSDPHTFTLDETQEKGKKIYVNRKDLEDGKAMVITIK